MYRIGQIHGRGSVENEVRLMKQDLKLLQDSVEMFDDSLSSAEHTSSAKAASPFKKSKESQNTVIATYDMNNVQFLVRHFS